MDEIQANIADDSVALNSMMNSVRARHLHAYRRRCLVNWKKRECMRMKLKITEMQVKIKRLLKQKRNLDAVLSKDINKRSSVEAPMMMLLSSLKSQCVERKKRVESLRTDMAQFVDQHRAAWNRADSAMKTSPRMALVEELKKELAGLKEKRDRIVQEKSAKKLAAQKDKEIFQYKIVEFAKMMLALKKTRELSSKIKELREKLKQKKSPTPENAQQNIENLGYPGINFGIFDVELDESSGEPCVQESVNGDGEFDLNCSVLSLGASVDGVGLTFGSSLGAPNAASTPYGGSELNQAMIAEGEDEDPEPCEEEVQEPMMVEAEAAKEDDVQEVKDVSENITNNSEEIDYRAKYAKSPENFPISAVTSPQTTIASTGFNFLSSVQEAAGVGSLFGFGPAEPNPSSIFNLF